MTIDTIARDCRATPLRRVAWRVALAGALLLPRPALAERAIDLPFVEHFDRDDYGDLVWVTGGATHAWQPTGGWSGGAARFTRPTTGNSYSGLGSFVGLADDGAQQINVRVLVRHGSDYLSEFAGAKFMIVVRNPSDSEHQRPMVYDDRTSDGTRDFLSYAPALGTYCQWDNSDYGGCWISSRERFKAYPGHYLDDWVSVELEFLPATGHANLYLTTRDGAFHGLYLTKIPMEGCAYSTPQTGGGLEYVDIIGGYFNNPTPAGANRYFEFDELQIDDRYIGPPPGFVGPACATAAQCLQPPACHTAAGATCNAGSCVYPAAPDGTSCAGGVCRSGVCTGCAAGASCSSADACQRGTIQCSSGAPVCGSLAAVADGTPCPRGACSGGACVASSPGVTASCGAAGAGVLEAALSALAVGLLLATRRRRRWRTRGPGSSIRRRA